MSDLNNQDQPVVVDKTPVVMNPTKADIFFKNFPRDKVVAYKDYWQSVKPMTHGDMFRRYLFAFCSVHTTFQGNVKGYQAIKNYEEWADNKALIIQGHRDFPNQNKACPCFDAKAEYRDA